MGFKIYDYMILDFRWLRQSEIFGAGPDLKSKIM